MRASTALNGTMIFGRRPACCFSESRLPRLLIAGVAVIYNRATYAAEKRVALDLWANHVAVLVSKANGANITKLRR